VDFQRRRPSAEALAWVERELGARVVSFRRLTGGIIAAVHRLTVEHVPSGQREFVVLRQYEHHGEVEREAGILRQAAGAGLPAPRLLAASATGAQPAVVARPAYRRRGLGHGCVRPARH
jgi:hypothetical protein